MITRLLKVLITVLLIVGFLFLIRLFLPTESNDTIVTPVPAVNGSILHGKVNTWRKTNDLPELPEEESLCKYAEERAVQIKTEWSHEQFHIDDCLKTSFNLCGENLSRGFFTEEETLEGWKNSPTHLENMKSTWANMCIRCVNGYCAQEFGI